MIKFIRKKFALSEQGAKDLIKGCIALTFSYLVLMFPVGLLYYLVSELMSGAYPIQNSMFYIAGIVVCLLLIFLTTYNHYNATYLATYIESGVRRISIAEKLRKLPLSFFGKKDLSDLTSTIMADCASLETSFSHYIPELVGSIISTIIIAIPLFIINWKMAIASLWVFPVAFCIVVFSSKVQKSLGRKQMKVKMQCADGIQECLETIRDLKANNSENEYLNGLDKKIDAVEKKTIINELGTAVFVVSANLVLKLGIATVALAGGIMLISNSIDVLTFFMYLLVVSRMYDALQGSLINMAAIIGSQIRIDRMNEILDYPSQTGKTYLTNKGYDIKFESVGFAYDGLENVLNDVSFIAKQGEVTALIGPSGGGKTTVSRLAARFWDVNKGKITIGGMDVSQIDPETLMSLFSIVFQDVILFNNTVMENIRIGRKDATNEEVIQAAKYAHCDEFVEKMPKKWNTEIGENGCKLSGGERQRISIARAFLKNAPIILLDEATASLDVENETLIQTSISELIKNKTVIVIAHRMRTIANADNIVILSDGKVENQGNAKSLLKFDNLYKHMLEVQAETQKWSLS